MKEAGEFIPEPHEIVSVTDLALTPDECVPIRRMGFMEARSSADDTDVYLYHPDHWHRCSTGGEFARADWTYYGVSFIALTDEARLWLGEEE